MDVGTHKWAIQPGDQVHITTEEFHGATKVNIAFMRCRHGDPIANVSFVNHLVHPLTDPENPRRPLHSIPLAYRVRLSFQPKLFKLSNDVKYFV